MSNEEVVAVTSSDEGEWPEPKPPTPFHKRCVFFFLHKTVTECIWVLVESLNTTPKTTNLEPRSFVLHFQKTKCKTVCPIRDRVAVWGFWKCQRRVCHIREYLWLVVIGSVSLSEIITYAFFPKSTIQCFNSDFHGTWSKPNKRQRLTQQYSGVLSRIWGVFDSFRAFPVRIEAFWANLLRIWTHRTP